MPWNDDSGPVPPSTEGELLARTREKVARLAAARRRAWMAAATAGLLVVAVTGAMVRGGPEDGMEIGTASGGASPATADPVTTTTVPGATTLAAPLPLPPPTTATSSRSPATTARPATSTTMTTPPAPAPSTTIRASCYESSFDPTCGPFRWEPPPGPNQPLTVGVTSAPLAPKPGDTVTFRVVVDDPDGSDLLGKGGIAELVDFGDGTPYLRMGGHMDCQEGYGSKPLPAPRPVHEELTFTHAYAKAGTYTVTIPLRTLGDCARPGNDAVGTTTVVVAG